MAVDTKAKRMNMLSFASPLAWGHHFEVDGAVDADDRAQLLHLYGGNTLGSPIEITRTIMKPFISDAVNLMDIA